VTPGVQRRYWRAVHELREAEALASIASGVSGPADAPPTEDHDGWVSDWTTRAKASLKKAKSWTDEKSGHKWLRERARKIAAHVAKGAQTVRNIPGKLKAKTKAALASVYKSAGTLFLAAGIGYGGTAIAIAVVAWLLLKKGK